MNAARWEIVATLKGMFGQNVTYLYTLLEGDNEIVLVNAFSPTDGYAIHKAEFTKLAESISGLHKAPVEPVDVHPSVEIPSTPLPVAAPEQHLTVQSKPATSQGEASVEDRLAKVNKLLQDGLITMEEHAAKRKEILKNL